jgi:hypothetical protein
VSKGRRIVSSCLAFGILAAPLASRAEPPDFLTELNLVREAMLDEPAKGYYEGPFNKAFYGRFSTWLSQCTQQTGQALSDLDLIVGLDSQGRVWSLRALPQSDLTRCFMEHVRTEQFPAPPSGRLRVPVSVRITKQ